MESVHIKLEKFPHLHSFLWGGVEDINDCYEEVADARNEQIA